MLPNPHILAALAAERQATLLAQAQWTSVHRERRARRREEPTCSAWTWRPGLVRRRRLV